MVLVVDKGRKQFVLGQTECCLHGGEVAGRVASISKSQNVTQGAPSAGLGPAATIVAILSCLAAGDGWAAERFVDTADSTPYFLSSSNNIQDEVIDIFLYVITPLTFTVVLSRYLVLSQIRFFTKYFPSAKPEGLSIIIGLFMCVLCSNLARGLKMSGFGWAYFCWLYSMDGALFFIFLIYMPYILLCLPFHIVYLIQASRNRNVYRTYEMWLVSGCSVIIEYFYLYYLLS
jgi:hypothetical protein